MLELKQISVGYAGRYQIPNVNLSFAPGKIYTVVGKNGSGKSGLLKLCSGTASPETGSVLLNGKNLAGFSENDILKQIGYLPQDRQAVTIPARRLVARSLPPKFRNTGKVTPEQGRTVYNCLGAMKAAGLAQLPMNQLSRGERRRVFMAALLAQDPEIFLLDEPFSDLDVEFRQLSLETILNLKAQGKTVVIAMQDLDMAMRYSDEMVVVDIGREVHTGTPDQIRKAGILEKVFHMPAPQ